jgi:Na+-driven multidrug efflux pump
MLEQEERVVVTERRVVAPPWSPAQFVALSFGALFLILGVATLAATGLSADTFTSAHVNTLGFHHTPLLGAIELVFGLLLIMAGAIPGAGRGTMAVLGTLALGFGIVVLIQAPSLHDSLGVHDANGYLYIATGIINLVASVAAPVIFTRQRRSVGYDQEVARTDRF